MSHVTHDAEEAFLFVKVPACDTYFEYSVYLAFVVIDAVVVYFFNVSVVFLSVVVIVFCC